jgi:hypothetical protein
MLRRHFLLAPATALFGICLLGAGCQALDRLRGEAPEDANVRGMEAGIGVPLTALVASEEIAITSVQLQSTLMAFADRYMARLSQAAADVITLNPSDPHLRLAVQSRKLYNCMAAQSIASGPNPEVALLDMVVLVTLDHMVIGDVIDADRPGADQLISALTDLEAEIWGIAEVILNQEQLHELREAITEYRTLRPEQREVSFVRFADFAGSRHQTPLLEAIQRGLIPNIMPGVDEAAHAVDETRLVAERALHLLEKMPIFLSWQSQLLLYDLAVTPEAEHLESGLSRMNESADVFARSTDRFARSFETLALQLSSEQAMRQTRETSAKIEELVHAVGVAAPPLQEAAQSIDRMFQNFKREPGTRDPNARPFDIEDYTRAFSEIAAAIRELDGLLESTESFLESPAFNEGLGLLDQRAIAVVDHTSDLSQRLLNRTFWRGLILIAVFWGLGLVTLVAARRWNSPRA